MRQITFSEKQTFEFAKKFAQKLKGGEVIGLIGELGAGKTIFTKGIAAGLGIKKNITSPTFVLMKVYDIPASRFRVPSSKFIHIDAYRIKSPQDITAIGAEEYFNSSDAVTVIEWADNIKKSLPKKIRYVRLLNEKKEKRKIIF